MNKLQKILLSAAAIVSFSFYTYVLRTHDDQIAAASSVIAANTTQQNPAAVPAPPSPTDFQTYVDQINAQAAQNQAAQQTRPAVISGEGESGQEDGGRRSRTVVQNTPPPTTQQQTTQQQTSAQAQAVAQAAAQAQAQQQAAQLAAEQQAAAQSAGQYKNGTYTGPSVNVFYGYVQVKVIIQNGQIADVQFLQYPSDRNTSRYINSQAMPLLKQEAIQAQSAQVNGVSGASATSQGFVQSLSDALSQA